MSIKGIGLKLKFPHNYVIVFSFIILAAIATWIVPAGEFANKKLADGK
jgi:uncharacterized ion transporter superfamily protein YfcC